MNVSPPSFVWIARHPHLLGTLEGLDAYTQGEGTFAIRVHPWFTPLHKTGPEVNVSEYIRFVSELMWNPCAMLNSKFSYRELSPVTVEAHFRKSGIDVKAILNFSLQGELLT